MLLETERERERERESIAVCDAISALQKRKNKPNEWFSKQRELTTLGRRHTHNERHNGTNLNGLRLLSPGLRVSKYKVENSTKVTSSERNGNCVGINDLCRGFALRVARFKYPLPGRGTLSCDIFSPLLNHVMAVDSSVLTI